MKLVFSSREVPSAKRFEAWREGICERYVHVDMVRYGPSDYVGYIKEASFGAVTLSDSLAPPQQHILRRRSHLVRSDKDCYYIGISVQGGQQIEQCGKTIEFGVGKAALFCASEPYELRNTRPTRSIYVEFPRTELLQRMSGKAPPLTSVLSTGFGIGHIAASLCVSLAAESEYLGFEARQRLGSDLLGILALAFEDNAYDPSDSFADSGARGIRLRQIKLYIEDHIGDPLLNSERIAKANQISVRSLHYLFKSTDESVTDYIWARRLEKCRKELQFDLGRHRTITEIAMEAGFNSLSHFSSLFRKRFGLSPSDLRKGADS